MALSTARSDNSLDLQDGDTVTALFKRAAAANLAMDNRSGAIVDLPAEGHMLVAGDLHDHRINFRKILKIVKLAAKPGNHLVLQETIHSERLVNGMDFSYRILAEVAGLQLKYPGQVHLLLSNHELSQVRGEDISKAGQSCVESFDRGMDYVFGDLAEEVREAMSTYVRSLPIAVRTQTGLFMAHSLPAPRHRDVFDPTVINRVPTELDYSGPRGDAHLMVWGRGLTQAWADDLAVFWRAQVFVLGHQHADMGYDPIGDTMLILNSDHQHGVVLPVDLSRSYTRDELIESVYPLASMSGS